MRLQKSIVRRGGVRARSWYGETREITGDVSAEGLNFRFILPSKGGGDTDILLEVGSDRSEDVV